MNTTEKLLFLNSKLMVLGFDKEHNAQEIEKVSKELAALQRQLDLHPAEKESKESITNGFVKFTNKEILQMPVKFRKLIRIEGCCVRAYKRVSGKHKINYELRYRQSGFNIYASSNDLQKAKEKFIEALHQSEQHGNTIAVPTTFHEFATYYFETFRKRKVSAETYKSDLNRYKKYLQPLFNSVPIKRITPSDCQALIDELAEADKFKTMEEVYSLLNAIFKNAIDHNIIDKNPMSIVIQAPHERQHGVSLTIKEEYTLLHESIGTPYQLMFAVALYTGLRPNEYCTARIEGAFIVAKNSKRKGNRIEYKKIPIIAKLKPYLQGVSELKFYGVNRIREKFRSILPNHKLYDLRTTFYTHCEECGVSEVARDEFVGHSRGNLHNAYTDLSDDFLLKEGNKIDY